MSDSTSSPQAAEKLPSNPRFFPRDRTPLYILKAKNGQFHCMMKEPDVSKNYLWYMSEPRLVPVEELEEAMKVPNRRWFATDKPSYEMQKRVGASIDAGVPYVCLRNINDPNEYWYGKRHAEPPVEKVMLVVTVAELYLKSSLHQKRLIRLLMDAMRRVLDNPQIFRNGNTLIEVRKERPNKEQLRLLSLIPGIAKIYDGVQSAERGGDPRGPFLMDGAGGIPIIPDQRVLACISGGIDSPVAAYRMMTRGCLVNGIHFLNSTNDTASVVGKNRGIGEELSRIQGRFDMFYVDISSLQSQIVANVPNQNRTLIYKWFMLALAASFDDENRFIVTGDSAGQVASQTVPNIGTLYPTISKAVIAPLIGMPKTYIMEVARKIHTYDLSIQEGADCCQYMMCKTGANLLMGRRTLEACVRRVKLNELPVLHEVYRDGALAESSRFSYLPEVTMRSGYALSARGKAVAQRPAEGDDDGAPAAAAAEEGEEDVVYFDAAAGTMMPERVKRAVMMAPEGNPNSLHHSGRTARMALEQVRVELASHLGVPAGNIFFTSGGTESNSIALRGYRVERDAWSHSSTRASPDTPDDAPVVKVVDLVNHETGSIAPSLTRPVGGRLHVDASQALLKLDMRAMDLSQVDSMTVSAHKINGPVGVGALYVRDPSTIHPIFTGGSQEKGVRPGTENVPAIVGFGEALRLNRSSSVHREIDAYMVEELQAMGCEVNRRGEVSGYILHATLPEGCDNTEVVARLSVKHHVEIGTGSACKTGEVNTTVYDTLGKEAQPKRSVRISWDAFATLVDAEKVVSALEKVLRELKKK